MLNQNNKNNRQLNSLVEFYNLTSYTFSILNQTLRNSIKIVQALTNPDNYKALIQKDFSYRQVPTSLPSQVIVSTSNLSNFTEEEFDIIEHKSCDEDFEIIHKNSASITQFDTPETNITHVNIEPYNKTGLQ